MSLSDVRNKGRSKDFACNELFSLNIRGRCLMMIGKGLAILIVLAFPQWGGAENSLEQNNKGILSPLESAQIGPNAVRIPLGKFLLVRKDNNYGAVKLTESRAGQKEGEEFAKYISFYQADGSGDFSRPNVQITQGELRKCKLFGIGRLAFDFGNKDIRCGPIRLTWSPKGWVRFYSTKQEQGDHGISLAPTAWEEISQVNVFESRIVWYKYDVKREDTTVRIDKQW
jgi:hypothetical protein